MAILVAGGVDESSWAL